MITIGPTSTFSEFTARLREFIGFLDLENVSGETPANEADFDRLALSLFGLQFSHNVPYRRFCEARNASPKTVKHWLEVPAMPTAGFKEFELTSLPPAQRAKVFHSSGTTEQRPSRHFHSTDSLAIYEASLLAWFREHFFNRSELEMNSSKNWSWLFLTPAPSAAPHSSLVHMFDCIRAQFASDDALFTGTAKNDGWEIDLCARIDWLREGSAKNQPVMLFGTAFNFVHLLDHLAENKLSFRLPAGSRVLETGGYKGRSRALARNELHALITRLLGIPANHIICEYGMSELSSQAYDIAAGNASATRVFRFPPWARVQIASPETGREVGEGETGLIRIFDLANVYSVMAIQTEDLGTRRGRGFELLGRAALAEPRGCSLMSR